jgi:putative transposase
LSAELRALVREAVQARPAARLKAVVRALGLPCSSFFRRPVGARRRPGPRPRPLDPQRSEVVRSFAQQYPWWGYKRLAVVLRRAGEAVTNRFVYRVLKAAGLLLRRRRRDAELYQAARLFELLPQGPNELWQADVTYLHIPGHGWWYAVTVIDYYSRYLLGLHLSPSFDAAALIVGIEKAKAEAERLHGPLCRRPTLVTDNGTSFLSRRFRGHIAASLDHLRTRYRTPEQLGLLERFHRTLKAEEVHWQLYRSPQEAREKLEEFRERYNEIRPHWALVPPSAVDPVTPAEVYRDGRTVGLPAWQAWARAAKEKLEKLQVGQKQGMVPA